MGSNQRTLPSLFFNSFWAVVFTSVTAPLTRARSAIVSGSIISLSAFMAAITASAASFTFLIGATNSSGNSVSRRSSSLRLR